MKNRNEKTVHGELNWEVFAKLSNYNDQGFKLDER